MSVQPSSFVRATTAAFSAVAVVLGLTAGAVALAPSASATDSITKIEVASTAEFLTWVPPVAGSLQAMKAYPGDTTVRLTATFTGTATFTVDSGEPITLTSTLPISVPIVAGTNRITVTHDGSDYPIDVIKNPGVDGIEVYNGADDSLIQAFTGSNFDPGVRNYNVKLAPGVTSVRFKTPHSGTNDGRTRLRWSGPACDEACAFSGAFTAVQNVPQGMTTYTLYYTRFDREIAIDVTIIRDDVPEGFVTVTSPQSAAGTINQVGSIPAAGNVAAGTYLTTGQIVLSGGSNGWRTFRIVHLNSFGGVVVDEQYTFHETVTAITADADGGFWVSGDSGSVQKFERTATGHYRPLPVFYGQGPGYIGTGRVYTDAQGYLYASTPYNAMNIFAPGAVNGDNPIRNLIQWAGGFAFDADGNILIGGFDGVEVYAPGTGSNSMIRKFGSGTITGLGVDGAGRIYANTRDTVRVYAPLSRGVGDPQLVFTKDISGWQSDIGTVIVDPQNDGKFAIVTGQYIQFFDISSVLPAVPTSAQPTVESVDFTGTAEVSQQLTATAAGVSGYPTPTVSYQWQTSANGTDGWTDVAGATGDRLVIPNSFADLHIRVKAVVASEAGSAEVVSSITMGPITAGPVRTQIGVMAGGATGVGRASLIKKISGNRIIVTSRYGWGSAEAGWYIYDEDANFNTKPRQEFRIPGVHAEMWGAVELPSTGNFLVSANTGKLYEVDKDANGYVFPLRTITTGCRGGDLAVGVTGDIYVGCNNESTVRVFAADATGAATPIRTIGFGGGEANTIGWTPAGELYVASTDGFLRYFAADADGSATPTKALNLGHDNWGVAYDAAGRIYVSGNTGLRIFPAGLTTTTPLRSVGNDNYSLLSSAESGNKGMVYIASTDQLIIAVPDNRSVNRYDAAAIRAGDPVAPAQVEQPQVSVSSRRIVVTWNALPSDVTGYRVTVTGGAGPFECETTTATTCTFSATGTPSYAVVDGVEYGVTVTAINGRLTGTPSPETRVTVAPDESVDPPGAPSNIRATGLNGTITVRWDAPAGSALRYEARAVSGSSTLRCGQPPAAAVTTTSCAIPNAVAGRTYSVQVRAIRVSGTTTPSGWSTATDVLARSTPTIGNVRISGTPRIGQSISGTAPAVTGTPTPTVQYVWQTSSRAATGYRDVTEPSASINAYELSIADIGEYVRLKVIADNGSGDPVVKFSNVIGEILTKDGETKASLYVVRNVLLSVTGTTMGVSWAQPLLGNPAAYTVTLQPGRGKAVTRTVTVTDTDVRRMSVDVSGLNPDTRYTVTVQVQGADATRSAAVAAVTAKAPGTVRSLRAAVRLSTVTVTWSAPSTGFAGTYRVTLTSTTGQTYSDRVSGTSKAFQPVAKGTYTVRVIAISDVEVAGAPVTVQAVVR